MMIAEAIEKLLLTVAGIFLNSILLYIIRRKTKASLGAYKHLLTIFISFDLILVIIHGLVSPKVVIKGRTFGVITDIFIENRSLLNIHFLYRFWTVRMPDRVELFTKPKFIFALTMSTLAVLSVWFCVCVFGCTGKELYEEGIQALRESYEQRYGKLIIDGWIVMDHFRNGYQSPRTTLTLLLFDAIMVTSFTVALSLGVLTYIGIRAEKSLSSQSRSLQLKLLIAVTAQTLVPLIFVYIPYFFVINLSYFGIPASGLDDQSMLMTACFPAWDAVIVISLIADYREAVLSMIPLTRWNINKKRLCV